MPRFAEAKFTVRAVNKTQKAFSQINQSVNRMDQRFGKLQRGLSKIGGLFSTLLVGKQVVDTITKFEKLEASLRTVTGSAEKASLAFGFIQEFASTTPFQLEEVTGAFIKLRALGLTPSEDALTSYGNTATAMGKSLNQMIEAVADATTGEFERLKEFGIKSKSQGDQVTFTFQGVSTTVGKNAKEIEAFLQSIGDVQFAGAMDEQANTLNVAMSNMGDSFSKLVKAIGDAGLTDILMAVANAIKWLAEAITAMIEPFKIGFRIIIGEILKFGNLFIQIFKRIGKAFGVFVDSISMRFEALGKDLAAFISDPFNGISFENTKKAMETGLLDSMGEVFGQAIDEAKRFNRAIDDEIQSAALKIARARKQKNQSLGDLFESTPSGGKGKGGKSTEKSQEKLKKTTKETGEKIAEEFDALGKSMERSMIDAFDAIGGGMDSFGDFFKGFLSDLNKQLLQFALKDLGITGEGGIISDIFGGIGDLFKGGGGSGGGGGFGSLLSGAASLFGGFFADGGTLKAGQFGVVGERGPELAFAGSSPMHITPNGAGLSPVNVTMNIQTPNAQSFRQSQTQIAADMARSIERARRNL